MFKYPYNKEKEAEDFFYKEPQNGLISVKQPFS
jgi:hypothetical protein